MYMTVTVYDNSEFVDMFQFYAYYCMLTAKLTLFLRYADCLRATSSDFLFSFFNVIG